MYFDKLNQSISKAYDIAGKARLQGKDPDRKVDIPIAKDLAARVEGLVSIVFPSLLGSGLAEGIRELEAKFGKNDERVALFASEMAANGKFGRFENLEKHLEAGVRIGVAYLTLGVVTAPLEGIGAVKITNGYVSIYYSGPIRSAGGTASAMSVIIADYVRRKLGIGDYKVEDIEKKRYAAEVEDYCRLVGMQYHPTDEEVQMIVENLKICLTGDPTEKFEVSNYKGLPRVETDKIRGGMCLVLGEGLALKAPKLLKRIMKFGKDFGLEDWMWLEKYNKFQKEIHSLHTVKKDESETKDLPKYTPSTKYIDKVIAGRPVIAYPSRPGGFRLRYGRSRAGGIAATSLHPGAMYITEFIAIGTQLATEHPGKATVCTPVDTVEPPVVLLKSGDVRVISNHEEAREFRKDIKKILSLGDILIPYGEFVSQNKILLPSAYCEEWWALEVEKAISSGIECEHAKKFIKKPYQKPGFKEALDISKKLNIPLHPAYNFFWHDITKEDLKSILSLVAEGTYSKGKQIVENDARKKVFEILCVPHKVEMDGSSSRLLFEGDIADCIYTVLGKPAKGNLSNLLNMVDSNKTIMSAINATSGIIIREKGLTRLGMKMGRPEKAERRIMKGSPQIIFPCGEQGGRMRNIIASCEKGFVESNFPTLRCPKCNKSVIFSTCNFCGTPSNEYRVCAKCFVSTNEKMHCGTPTVRFKKTKLNIKEYVDIAAKNVNMALPELFKGVRGASGRDKDLEILEKGLLRVKYNLYVNKDGTTRFDATDMPLTHFKPCEVNASVDALKKQGYEKDTYGNPFVSDSQTLELKVQDIIISDNSEFSGADYFIKLCNFVDDLLKNVYHMEPFYKISRKEDLIGLLVIGLAPHTSAGIIGRIIGFTPAKVCFAHPFWHAAKRRNADGDEDSILLLMDALLNFSRKFLPTTRGAATMDAPLVLTTNLDPEEVDDEAWNVDVQDSYPLSFYEDTFSYKYPWELREKIKTISSRIGTPAAYHSMFTHDTSNINDGPHKSKYVILQTMYEKITSQLDLATRIIAVDESDVAEKLLEKHFLKDIKGNLRTFSRQTVRCSACNEKYRRVPLMGKCTQCGEKLLLTVHEGTIRKYIEPAKHIMEKFSISSYLMQQFSILEAETDSLFGKKARQLNLAKFNSAQ